MVGQVLDHYAIEAQLGAGGMGVVYKAYDMRLQRPVAIKFLVCPADDAARAILQEARAVSALNHPHICTIYEAGEWAGQAYIVMEYVEGRPLDALIPPDGLTVDSAVEFGIQITDAVAHAHDHGVIHRDLKTANIVVTPEGRAKVLDFGLASRSSSAAQVDAITRAVTMTGESTDTVSGTLAYMPPEVLRGQPADVRSDIWALGVILYEMISGHRPFNGRCNAELCTEILREPPWPLPSSIDVGLRAVVSHCMMKEPRQRYSRAIEVRAALEAIRALERPLERSSVRHDRVKSAPVSVWRRASRRSIVATGGVIALIALTLGVPHTRRLVLPSSSSPTTRSTAAPGAVAVFPFRALGSETEVDHIARGVAETLAARLVQSRIHVASGDAVERAASKGSLQEAARELGVDLAVTGTVQQVAGRLRIIVNVEDVKNARRLWAEQVSAERSELLSLEDRLHAGLLDALGIAPPADTRAADTGPTVSFEAYDLYLKGRNAARGRRDAASTKAAIEFYRDALRKDGNFALAYAGMSEAMLQLYRDTKQREWADQAQFAAEQAHRLGPTQTEAHLALGAVYNATGKAQEAITVLERALKLSPKSDEAYRERGLAYAALGRGKEALQSLQKAVEIDPYDWMHHNALGSVAINLGRYSDAAQAFRSVIELEPARVTGYSNLGAVHLYLGQFELAADAFEKALKLEANASTYTNLGLVYASTGRFADAVRMFEKSVEINPGEARISNLADGYRWLRQPEKAAPLYDKAIALVYKRLQVNSRDAEAMANLALYYAKKGDASRATEFMTKARGIEPENVTFAYYEAVIHQLAGRTPDALRALREAFRRGYRASFALADPEFNRLRSDAEFQNLVREFSGTTR